MQKEEAYYSSLLSGFIEGTATPDEVRELFDFIEQDPAIYQRIANREDVKQLLSQKAADENADLSEQLSRRMRERLLSQIEESDLEKSELEVSKLEESDLEKSEIEEIEKLEETETPVIHIQPRRTWIRYSAAAAAILIGIGSYFYFGNNKQSTPTTEIAKTKSQDVLPGSAKAVLTLADNKQIVLDSAANGELAKQGNTDITKTAPGELAYNESKEKPGEILMNTLTVPRGGTYQLTLPDGTKVWLNAASSITYPTAFTGNNRHVDVTGELYFEVKHDASKPFSVSASGIVVEDIGTHFNINAYSDEDAIKTTLLEGSVRVKENQQSKILVPGQQARVTTGNAAETIQVRAVDADAAVAWKDGFFHFEKSGIKDVMRQLSRWYDIDVEFEKPVSDHLFGGKISRNLNLTEVLDVLKTNNIVFTIEGRKIIVQ